MPTSRKLLLIDIGVKLLIVGIITVWLTLIYTIATSEATMLRQLLGCMLSTMLLFGVMSAAVGALKSYAARLGAEGE